MSLYDDLGPVVADLLAEFKQGTVKLVIRAQDTGDEPWKVGQTLTTVKEIDAAVSGVPKQYLGTLGAGGALIVASDLMVVCPITASDGSAINFDLIDYVRIDNIDYVVRAIKPKPPAGTPVAYQIVVGK